LIVPSGLVDTPLLFWTAARLAGNCSVLMLTRTLSKPPGKGLKLTVAQSFWLMKTL
jgi:hypothetical protein